MKREEILIQPAQKMPLFYASLLNNTTAEIDCEGDGSTYYNYSATITSDGLRISTGNGSIMWNCHCPANTDLTFSCWIKKTGGSGVYYSFGTSVENNQKYKGLQYANGGGYWLVAEYLYFFYNGTNYPTPNNTWSFVSWSIIYNGSNSYTVKFYRDGALIVTKTFTNSQWQGMNGSRFAISHNVNNSMYAYYKHFSCYPLLTDDEVLELYQRGGVAA